MFDDINNMESIIESLRLEEVLYRNEPAHSGNFLSADDYYIYAWEALHELADEQFEVDYTDSVLYKFGFPSMIKFYDLCREHSKRNKINFKKNPYVIAAEEYIRNSVNETCARNFAWNLWVPRKIVKKKRYIFLIETGCYFDDYVDMLELLYDIRSYYEEQSKILEKELSKKSKAIRLPAAGKEMGKAV